MFRSDPSALPGMLASTMVGSGYVNSLERMAKEGVLDLKMQIIGLLIWYGYSSSGSKNGMGNDGDWGKGSSGEKKKEVG